MFCGLISAHGESLAKYDEPPLSAAGYRHFVPIYLLVADNWPLENGRPEVETVKGLAGAAFNISMLFILVPGSNFREEV